MGVVIMSDFSEYYTAIDDIKSSLHRDLIGPITVDEVIESVDPLSYYVMGILWAKRLFHEAEPFQEDNLEELSIESFILEECEDVTEGDDGIENANSYRPSAMGISAMLPPNADILKVSFSYGKYTYSEKEVLTDGLTGDKTKSHKVRLYSRTP
jgi:hypothetical protein